MGMRQSDDVRLVQNIPCPSPTPLAAGETADISSTEAVLGEEDADEVDAFSFAARRDVDASSMVAVLGHEDEDEEEPTNAMELDFVDALTGSNTSLASFPGFDVAMFALGQGRSATLAVPPKDDGDTRSIEAVLGAEDALAMEATADVVEEALQVPQEEDEETDASSDVDLADSIVFTFDSALAHALSLAPTPAHGQDPDLALILADADITEDAPWKALCTRTWTREDAARALLFIPWCALVGAAICLHPRTVGRLVFQPSSSSSSSPTFLSLPLPRSPAPPTPIRRLAHHAHTALGHVACFVFVLGALAWVFPVLGMGVGLGVGGGGWTWRVWALFSEGWKRSLFVRSWWRGGEQSAVLAASFRSGGVVCGRERV
ncbi:hypothetical protein OF83DRAFT_336796 [Amylostereum chailletii]|nr:hypothetical protein OF83DRAFT_336796 [Amylostereum chailletii]